MSKLIIKDLYVSVENKEILKGVNLTINSNDNVALLGPNGHGKSTLFMAIMGHPKYVVTKGNIYFDDKDITNLNTDERSKLGLFLGFQNPMEIPGVVNLDFLKNVINLREEKPLSLFNLYKKLESTYKEMEIPFEMINRNLNEGFSGGEKKKNEILQMMLLNPKLSLLDEIDSGLDVDAINVVANAINKKVKEGMGLLVISHYARLFDLIKPTRAAIMVNGRIVVDGDSSLIKRVDKEGYEWIKNELGISIEKEDQKEIGSIGTCAVKKVVK